MGINCRHTLSVFLALVTLRMSILYIMGECTASHTGRAVPQPEEDAVVVAKRLSNVDIVMLESQVARQVMPDLCRSRRVTCLCDGAVVDLVSGAGRCAERFSFAPDGKNRG